MKICTAPHARKHAKGFAEGILSRKACGSFVADMKLVVAVCVRGKAWRSDYTRSGKVLLRTRNATLALEEPLPTAGQPGTFRGRLAEAWKGGPVFAGKCPRSTGSSMEPKPTGCGEALLSFLT